MGLVTRLTMCKLYIMKAVKLNILDYRAMPSKLYVHVKTCICPVAKVREITAVFLA